MNIQLIMQLLVLIEEIKSRAELILRFETLISVYRFEYYGFVLQKKPVSDPESLMLVGRWPKGWEEIYVDRKYILVDPSVRMLGIAQRPFRWRDAAMAFRAHPHRQRMHRMMQEGARNGLHDGYIFPIHGRSGLLGNLSLGGRVVDLSPAEIALFDAVAQRMFWRLLEIDGRAEALETSTEPETHLTRREMDVILLLADGMTSNEIGRALSISSHTVDWYINGLQDKLRAKNRPHVISLAFRLGLVV